MEMCERIREIRKKKGLKQAQMALKLGVKTTTVTSWETGLRNPSEIIIVSICREFGVNETWLRTGEGEMFLPKSQEEELAEFMADIMKEADATFRARFIKAVSRFNKDQWHALESVVMALYEQDLREKK